MSLDLHCTHLLAYRVGGQAVADAVARAGGPGAAGLRYFVPGFLPCGECPLCRRGLVGACGQATRPLGQAAPGSVGSARPSAPLALSERFVAALDEPTGVEPLSDEIASLAGVVAFALHALAAASLAPGDFAVWLGDGPVASAGAALSAARGASSFLLPGAHAAARAQLATELAALAAVPATVHGSRKRLLFLTEPSVGAWSDAAQLGEPGATFVALGASATLLPGPLTLPAEARVLVLTAYHPDFVPEALAALRRPELEPLRQRLRNGQQSDPGAGLILTSL